MILKFRRAYHVNDTSKEEAMLKLWNEIVQSGAENLNSNDLIDALRPIGIVLNEESTGIIMEQIEEDVADDNLNYEDFLRALTRSLWTRRHGKRNEAHPWNKPKRMHR